MTGGLTVWWVTPTRPDAHFSAEELAASERYHRPLRRVGMAAAGTKVVLLALAGWLAGGPLAPAGETVAAAGSASPSSVGLAGASLLAGVTSPAVVLGAAATTAALRLPAIAGDVWFEYRFRHGRDIEPVPVSWFASVAVALAVGMWAVLVVAGALVYRAVAEVDRWPTVLSLVVLVLLAAAAMLEQRVRSVTSGSTADLQGTDEAELRSLASRLGVAEVRFEQAPDEPGTRGAGYPGVERGLLANAFVAGLGSRTRVVLTDGLLAESRPLRDFVVAHELIHLRRRHLVVQALVTAALSVVVVQVLGLLAAAGWPWSGFDLVPEDPRGMPVAALVVLLLAAVAGPVAAWLARAQERAADAGAIAELGPLDPETAHRLLAGNLTDLDGPWWTRLYGHHPTPSERLEFIARHRRATW